MVVCVLNKSVKYEDPETVEGLAEALDSRLQVTAGVRRRQHLSSLQEYCPFEIKNNTEVILFFKKKLFFIGISFQMVPEKNVLQNDIDKWISSDLVCRSFYCMCQRLMTAERSIYCLCLQKAGGRVLGL